MKITKPTQLDCFNCDCEAQDETTLVYCIYRHAVTGGERVGSGGDETGRTGKNRHA